MDCKCKCKLCGKDMYFHVETTREYDWSKVTTESLKADAEYDKQYELEQSKKVVCPDCKPPNKYGTVTYDQKG